MPNQLRNGISALMKLIRLSRKAVPTAEDRELVLTSGLFDPDYYLETYPDVKAAGFDAADHFIRHGALEGRNPSARFDSLQYLTANKDLKAAQVNPLIHYLRFGMAEGRTIRAVPAKAPRPRAPSDDAWSELASKFASRTHARPMIDVVIPVYRGLAETANCIATAVRSQLASEGNFEVVVIDDESPEPELSALLNRLAAQNLITLLRNEANLGFTASVNRGMALHPDRDVILLNSDTEVYGNWVERMRRVAYSAPDIGTVTPLSNNATICSYPNFAGEFDGAFEIPFEELDRLASVANRGLYVDVPTGVGFCMYIRRDCLREVGQFDVEAFGRGYGEENDFCFRAAALGWRNVLTGEVFVRHIGRVSFLTLTPELGRRGMKVLLRRYPNYNEAIAGYIQNDPPRELRRNLDVARVRRAAGERSFLFVEHNLGGGTHKHTQQLSMLLAEEGVGTILCTPLPEDANVARISVGGLRDLSVAGQIDLKHGLTTATALIRDLGVIHIHVHQLIGFAPLASDFFPALARACGVRYDVTLHDYRVVCPRIDMIDPSGKFCNNSDLDVCEACVKKGGSPSGDAAVWQWRITHERFLAEARSIFVPDEDVRDRLRHFLPSVKVTVRPHPEDVPNVLAAPVPRQLGEPLRVALIGAVGPHKGSQLLLRCAEDAQARKLPLQFLVVGYTDNPRLERLSTVKITGAYRESELPSILQRLRCHIAFLPSICPETYSYTLSQAFFAGLYPVAFDFGAIGRRIRAGGWGRLIPLELTALPSRINDILLSLEVPPLPDTWPPVPGRRLYSKFLTEYYGLDFEPPPTAINQQESRSALV